jgi:4-diphosphocytidyl-2C-methyl-D-erythritol kinase
LEGKHALRLLANDLERAALEEAPALKQGAERIRGMLVRAGAGLAALTGSGSTYFGLFDGAAPARRARKILVAAGFTTLLARTVSLGQYRRVWSRSLGR